MMDIFGARAVVPNHFRMAHIFLVNTFEASDDLRALIGGEDCSSFKGQCMGAAGFQLLRQKTPVEGEGALPLFEERIRCRSKAAGPHFGGLISHEVHSPFVVPLLRRGISEP